MRHADLLASRLTTLTSALRDKNKKTWTDSQVDQVVEECKFTPLTTLAYNEGKNKWRGPGKGLEGVNVNVHAPAGFSPVVFSKGARNPPVSPVNLR